MQSAEFAARLCRDRGDGGSAAPPQRPVPVPYKTCIAAFDPAEYGAEYLKLSERDFVEELDAPTAAEGWAFGRIVYADGGRSEPGWYPPAFAR